MSDLMNYLNSYNRDSRTALASQGVLKITSIVTKGTRDQPILFSRLSKEVLPTHPVAGSAWSAPWWWTPPSTEAGWPLLPPPLLRTFSTDICPEKCVYIYKAIAL